MKYSVMLLLVVLAMSGCSRRNAELDPSASITPAMHSLPSSPPGYRLGQSYLSALNEPCFEVFPEQDPRARALAYCYRDGAWQILTNIYMVLPGMSSPGYPK